MRSFSQKKNRNIILNNSKNIKLNMNNYIGITKSLLSIKTLWIFFMKNFPMFRWKSFQVDFCQKNYL